MVVLFINMKNNNHIILKWILIRSGSVMNHTQVINTRDLKQKNCFFWPAAVIIIIINH